MEDKKRSNLTIANAEIMYKNFAGREEGKYNPAGNRNFCLIIPEEYVDQLREDGWNIKQSKQRDPEDAPRYYIPVAVKYGNPRYPVRITVETANEGKKKVFAESEIGVLDWAEIVRIDKVVVRPRVWDDNGTEKIKAYLRSMKVVIDDEDYEDMDEMEVDDDDMPF